jgi:polyisoprenoid-binding protein YceI
MFRKIAFGIAIVSLASAAVAVGVTDTDPAKVPAGAYVFDGSHTSAAARVSHLGFTATTVMFDKIDGGFTYDPAKPETSKLNVTIDTSTLSSGFALRDTHLKGEKWFNTMAHPTITFTADRLVMTGVNTADIPGNLTILGVTKPITLKAKFNGVGENMRKAVTVGLEATTTLKRSDFGMTSSIPAIGDEATIQIDVEATKQQ